MPYRRCLLVVLVLVCIGAPKARAEGDLVKARQHYLNATRALELNLFNVAIEEYTAAYEIMKDPVLLYNVAQAHRAANHLPEALEFYRIYLDKRPQAPNRASVEAKIIEVQKLLAPTAPPPKSETESTTVGTKPASDAARSKQIAGRVVLGVGVAFAAVGIGTGVLAYQTGTQLTNDSRNGLAWDPAKHSSGQLYQALEATFLTLGCVAVVTGVVLWVVGDRQAKTARRASIAPTLSGHGAGVTVEMPF